MKKAFTGIIILWISYVFLRSLPYKFSWAPETDYIFSAIWEWMSGIFWTTIWNGFANYWAIGTWIAELIVSSILIIGLISLLFCKKWSLNYLIAIWGTWAFVIMFWAAFFHLFTPLWIEVNWDWWSLFKAAISILFLGLILSFMYKKDIKNKFCKK